jgi:hypothetical protein
MRKALTMVIVAFRFYDTNSATRWTKIVMSEWYGDERCSLNIVTGTAIATIADCRLCQSAGCLCAIRWASATSSLPVY